MFNTEIFTLHAQDGFKEVGTMVESNEIQCKDFKIIILLMGRADLWDSDANFGAGIASCLQAIRNVNPLCFIMFTAIIPVPGDKMPLRRTAGYRHGYMSYLAGKALRLEFSRPGKFLLQRGEAIPEYYDAGNNLNGMGLDLITRGLEAKVKCAGIFKKFEDAKKGVLT